MRVSVQLYTLRDQLAEDVRGTLRAIRKMGIEYVELAGFYGESADAWAAHLQEAGVASLQSGLKASGAHIGLGELENNLDQVIADAKTIGFKYVIVPHVGPDVYAEGWAKFGERLAPIGAKLAENDLVLLYHNHDFEFADGDGLAELYGAAPTTALQAEIDAAWVSIGGKEPAAYIQGLAGRVPCVHVKDYNPENTPRWVPAGTGIMPMPAVLAAAEAAGTEFIVIELDESPGSPLDAVEASYEYLKTQGYE
jgi:hypothetical protein